MLQVLDGMVEAAPVRGDPAIYYLGTMPSRDAGPPHRVVLCVLPEDGSVAAAHACTNLQRSWDVRQIIMCGIACGVPNPADPERHVRLGDVLVAEDGVIPYGHVRAMPLGEEIRRHPAKPSVVFKRATRRLRIAEEAGQRPWDEYIDARGRRVPVEYRRPAEPPDELIHFDSGIAAPHPPISQSGHLARRPKIHYGRLGSGGKLINDSVERNRLARQYRLLGFDMEGDGVSDGAYLQGAEWFMVRGVSDYGVRKNDRWHRYASLAAASYVRALLGETAALDTGAVAHLVGADVPAPGDGFDVEAVVEALLEVRSLRDRSGRDRVISELPSIDQARQVRGSSAYRDVKELVESLRRNPGGLRGLYQVLLKIEKESVSLRRLGRILGE
ncbi:MAG TPA: hypothetical protein VN408_29085 [Actinoplanes sp.]|nr:hypothetical protein [Actinoplanes sp.]